MNIVIIALVVIVVIAGILWKISKGVPVVKQETLSLAEIAAFFKEPETLEKLKANPNFIAVAVRKNLGAGTQIVLTLFDKTESKIEDPLKIYEVKQLDEKLASAFGDKEMIVLN